MEDLKVTDLEVKKQFDARLARIEGQLRGVWDMVQREGQFEKVAQQMSAVCAKP